MTSDTPARSRRKAFGDGPRADDAADVRRDDREVAAGQPLLDVLGQHGRGEQVIGRDIEEALDLPRMQVEGEDPVGARDGDQVGDQLGRDRRARARFPVLPGIAEIGDDRGDPAGRAAPQRVQRDQKLHEVVVRREGGRLDDEDVLAAHVLVDLHEHFHVREAPHAGLRQRQVQVSRDRLGQRPIAVAGENLHSKPPLSRRGSETRRRGPSPRHPAWPSRKSNPTGARRGGLYQAVTGL